MKKLFKTGMAVMLAALFSGPAIAANYAWPEKFEGVMLQGFYWDSFKGTNNTKWATLTEQADELSKYFKIIWVPNGAKCASSPSNGYDPVYWFSNYNTTWGTEAQLREMIQTYKAKGTGIMADVVINHRSGVSNWTNFPKETWNGQVYQLGPEHICSNDEVAYAAGQARPTGAPDTGENFDGSRDLDHTSAEVQRNCKAYCQFLIQDMGYCGFRLDMVKGYAGRFTKIYNEASHPTYSVGEYFDGNYDAVAGWIEATGKQSAAFDFPLKFQLNKAFSSNNMTELSWKANGTTDQPAGMIHFGYQQYAVTFVENHDTYRDHNKFNGNVMAAYAFILCSPGTPCVFYPHYTANKAAIQALINVRNACGVHNTSAVKVLQVSNDCYMAEVYGTKGTLVVKVGSSMASPSGYSSSDIKASGNGYCVWTKTSVNNTTTPVTPPSGDAFTVYFDNSQAKWVTPHIHYWGNTESVWPGVAMSKHQGDVWKYTVPAGTTGLLFNAGDGDATKTQDFEAHENHIYDQMGSQGVYGNGTPTPTPTPGSYPATVYLVGSLNGAVWDVTKAIPAAGKDGVYEWNNVDFVGDAETGLSYFAFITQLGTDTSDWDTVNGSDRYGALTNDAPISVGGSAQVKLYAVDVDASASCSWAIAPGKYKVTLNLSTMQVSVTTPGQNAVEEIGETQAEPVYFNLQGVRVDNPENGLYIVVRGTKVSKEYVRK